MNNQYEFLMFKKYISSFCPIQGHRSYGTTGAMSLLGTRSCLLMSDYHPGKEGTVRLEPLVVPASKGGLNDQWDHPRMWGLPGGTPTGLTIFIL